MAEAAKEKQQNAQKMGSEFDKADLERPKNSQQVSSAPDENGPPTTDSENYLLVGFKAKNEGVLRVINSHFSIIRNYRHSWEPPFLLLFYHLFTFSRLSEI